MAEVLVIGKKISEMGLVNEITGEEKIPTSALGDKAVTTSQLLAYVNNNGVAQWGRIGGDIANQVDLQNQFTQERDTLKSYTQEKISQESEALKSYTQEQVSQESENLKSYTQEQVFQQQVALQGHIDATNEVFKYARDNGSALPYKEGISYEENAVVVKDGELQQWKGGEWVQAANKGYNLYYFTEGKSYPLNAQIMLENGDIVKSTVDGNVNDPNFDMAGWVKTNDASQITDASGLSQQEINNKNNTISHVALMLDAPVSNGKIFNVLSRDEPNFSLLKPYSGGGLFKWDASSTAAPNGGTVFAHNTVSIGRFLRIIDSDAHVSWFAGHGWTGEDKTARVQKAIDFTNKIENALALKVDGKYTLTGSLIIDRKVDTTKGDYIIYAEGNNDGFRIDTPITMFSSSILSDFPAAGYTRHPVSEFVTFRGLDFEATVAHLDNCVFDDKFLRITFDGCTHRKMRGCKSAQYLQSITYTGINKFRQHVGYFIDVQSAYDLRFNGMQFENSADGFNFTGNVFGGYFDGNLFQGSGQFLRVNAMAGGSISKNYFEANADQEIIFTGAGNGVAINGNLFYTAPDLASDVNFYHIQLGSSFGVSLQGNRALHNLADNSNAKVFTIVEGGNRVEAGRKVLKIDNTAVAQPVPTASGTQANSLPIKNLVNAIYTDVASGGLLLPKLSELGSNTQITVINNSGTTVNIFPNDGERILGGAYNAPHPLGGFGNSVVFYKGDSDYWIGV